MEGAFEALRQHARDHNLRLSDVAAAVVAGSLRPTVASPRLRRPTS